MKINATNILGEWEVFKIYFDEGRFEYVNRDECIYRKYIFGDDGVYGIRCRDSQLFEKTPFPRRWKLSKSGILTMVMPVPPIPEAGLKKWTRGILKYKVETISDLEILWTNQDFDSDNTKIGLRRT